MGGIISDPPPCFEPQLKELKPGASVEMEIYEFGKVNPAVPVAGGFRDERPYFKPPGPGRYEIVFVYEFQCGSDDHSYMRGPVLSRPISVELAAQSR